MQALKLSTIAGSAGRFHFINAKVLLWQEELNYWKEEAQLLRRLAIAAKNQKNTLESSRMEGLRQSLNQLLQHQIPAIETALPVPEAVPLRKDLDRRLLQVDQQLVYLRRTVFRIKAQLSPILKNLPLCQFR